VADKVSTTGTGSGGGVPPAAKLANFSRAVVKKNASPMNRDSHAPSGSSSRVRRRRSVPPTSSHTAFNCPMSNPYCWLAA
jgi:hypothetical protein